MRADATARGKECLALLEQAGRDAGWTVVREYPVPGGRVDLVWTWQPDSALAGAPGPIPIVGFEVESSWRTRQHVKGDLVNLAALQAALGVIVLLGLDEGDGLLPHAEELVERWPWRIVVWTERDVEGLVNGLGNQPLSFAAGCASAGPSTEDDPASTTTSHAGGGVTPTHGRVPSSG